MRPSRRLGIGAWAWRLQAITGAEWGFRVRAYPDPDQVALHARTFGCVRVVWNRTLAVRQAVYTTTGQGVSYPQTVAALTAMRQDPGFAWLTGVSSVPLQQTLRHQYDPSATSWSSTGTQPARTRSRRPAMP